MAAVPIQDTPTAPITLLKEAWLRIALAKANASTLRIAVQRRLDKLPSSHTKPTG